MKTLLSLIVLTGLSLSSVSFADEPLPVYMKVRKFIETQSTTPDSDVQKAVQALIKEGQLPHNSRLELAGVDLLQEGPKLEEKKCFTECHIYEISEYRQISDIRWRSDDGTKATFWLVGIYASYVKAWTVDQDGHKLKAVGEQVVLDAVTFLR